MHQRTQLALALAASLSAACGGNGTSGGAATMNVHLVDATADYVAITLDVQKVEISTDGNQWLTLGSPAKTVDLLSLTNGVEEMLAHGASLPAGSYGQMRLLLGPNNTVTLASDPSNPQPLKVPSGMQSGLKMPVSFDVAPGTTKDVFIDFDAHRSIFLHGAGASGQYLLRPVVRAVDKVVTGSIGGTLEDDQGKALQGQTVYAESVDGSGNAAIVTSAITDGTGAYTLGLLPVGGTYYVVAQPFIVASAGSATVYGPVASAATSITASAPIATVNLATSAPATQYGSITATVSDASGADAGHTIYVSQPVATGIGSETLIVRTQDAAGTPEVATTGYLPVGTYAVSGMRTVANADGTTTMTPSLATTPTTPIAVTSGGNTQVTVTF